MSELIFNVNRHKIYLRRNKKEKPRAGRKKWGPFEGRTHADRERATWDRFCAKALCIFRVFYLLSVNHKQRYSIFKIKTTLIYREQIQHSQKEERSCPTSSSPA